MTDYRLHTSLGYNLSLAARLQERRFEETLKTIGLTRITWCILLAVGVEKLTQPSDIAVFVGIDRTATSRALRQMQAAGLIERQAGKSDGRTRSVALTKAGIVHLEAGAPMAEANNAAMLRKLSPREHDELLRLLAKLTAGEMAGLSNF